jgi:fucose 4-O-acetylase-like acetyltransferase
MARRHAFADPPDVQALPLQQVLVWWAVPTFFFASGYLRQTSEPVPMRTLGRWLVRLLVPYAIAALLACAYRVFVLGQSLGPGGIPFVVVTGSAWPVYYFVPMLAGACVLAAALSRVPGAALPLFCLIAPVVPAGLDPVPHAFGLFWLFRSPFMWWGYFLLGWLAAAHAPRLAALGATRRRRLGLAAALVFAAVAAVCLLPGSWRSLFWPPLVASSYAAIAAMFLLGFDAAPHPAVRWLADASYPIYLYHFFFTSAVRTDLLRLGALAEPAAFAAGAAGSLAVVVVGRRLLGERARLVLG